MARISQEDVEAIIEVDLTSIPDLTPFIDVANSLVTELCTSSGYSDTRLAQIEVWLAAHFYAVRDPRRSSEAAGSVSQSLQSKVDVGLSVTHYGQQAMILDTAGNLSRINGMTKRGKGKVVCGVAWLGTDPYTDEEA